MFRHCVESLYLENSHGIAEKSTPKQDTKESSRVSIAKHGTCGGMYGLGYSVCYLCTPCPSKQRSESSTVSTNKISGLHALIKNNMKV